MTTQQSIVTQRSRRHAAAPDTDFSSFSDEALVMLCQQRHPENERPFQELYQRHIQMVRRLSHSFLRNPQDAEDLAQDVFVKVYRYLPQFEARATFKTWLYRITVNTCRNELRRRGRRPQESEVDLLLLSDFLPGHESTEQLVEARAQRRRLATVLTEMRPEETEILMLKDVEERPFQEIADHLSISVSAAKMRAKRARHALKVAYLN